jgi:hypothetical protein
LDVEPDDEIRWTATEDGELSVEVVQQRCGVSDDVALADIGETDAVKGERGFRAE